MDHFEVFLMPFFPKSKKIEHLIPENEKMGIKCSVFWDFDTLARTGLSSWPLNARLAAWVFYRLPAEIITPEVLLS